MAPRYDADYDARQCVVRNSIACAACVNRVAFIGKRGAKGAWNKPCQGAVKPDPAGTGRLRCSYGGNKIAVHALNDAELDMRPHTPEPEPEPRLERPGSLIEPMLRSEQAPAEQESDAEVIDMEIPLDVLMEEVNALHAKFENPRTRRTYRSGQKGFDEWAKKYIKDHDGVIKAEDVTKYMLLKFRKALNIHCKRNGPSAYFTLISGLERRRQEQEDAGLSPTSKSLYKVTSIKRIIGSVVNEHRAAKSKVPEKNSTLSWNQVMLCLTYARTDLKDWDGLPKNPSICNGNKGLIGLVVQLAILLQLFGGRRSDDVLNMSYMHTKLEAQPIDTDDQVNSVGPSPATLLKFTMTLNKSSHATHATYARHARPDLCVHGAAAEVLACMYGGANGMKRLQQDLESGAFDACKVIPGKSGKTMNRTYLSQYMRQCLLKAGVDMEAPVSDDFEWHLKNVSGHLLKKFAGNLLNCLASKGVAVDHVRAFLSHMNDTTHLDYLESFVPAAILLAGHGPDWQNHHRIGRAVQVPDELMEALCPGLPHLMETYPGKLHLFKHLMVVMIQDAPSKMMEYESSVAAPSLDMPAQKYWQANEHLRDLFLHPVWKCFALETLVGQAQAQIWRLNVRQRLRYDDEESPQMQGLQDTLTTFQEQLAAAKTAPVVTNQLLTQKQAVRELRQRNKVVYNPSLTSVQPVWDQFWRLEQQLAQGWSYQDNRSMEQQSKLRHGLVGWVLMKVGVALPMSTNKPGPYAALWHIWSKAAVQDQLRVLEERLQSTTATNRRTGQLGALKSALTQEFVDLKRRAAKKAAKRAAKEAKQRVEQKAARKTAKKAREAHIQSQQSPHSTL